MVSYSIIRSRRKTISIRIDRDLQVTVRAPMRTPAAQIEQFVQQHQAWLQKHMDKMGPAAQHRQSFHYGDGQRIPFWGGELELATGEGKTRLSGDRLLLPPGADRPAETAEFLREQARALVTQWIAHYAPQMHVQPMGVKITSAATRWGSCSGRNRLCFSYRVACLPEPLLCYIVVHELAHIVEHNHSPRFWHTVELVLPDYLQRRRQLREFETQLPF